MSDIKASEPIRVVGVPEHFNLPWHMALQPQGGDSLPVPFTWTDAPGGTGDMCRALSEGTADLAVLLTEGIIKHIAGGGDARIVGTYTETPLVWGIHVAAKGPIQSTDDLRGARYAISRIGSGSHLMAALDAAQRGWETPEFVVVGTLEAAREALANNKADAFMWEKTMTLPFVHSGEWRRVGEFSGPWPAFVIAASDDLLERGVEWFPALSEHLSAACARADQEREATVAFIGDKYNIPVEDILTWLDETRWRCEPTVSRTMLAKVVSILADADIVRPDLQPLELVDRASRLSE